MTWRRLAEMLHFRHAVELAEERSTKAKELAELKARNLEITVAIKDMSAQARLGSYHRIRIGREG